MVILLKYFINGTNYRAFTIASSIEETSLAVSDTSFCVWNNLSPDYFALAPNVPETASDFHDEGKVTISKGQLCPKYSKIFVVFRLEIILITSAT